MSAASILAAAVKNFQPNTSVIAGGAASILSFAIGCVLVAAGVTIPIINVPVTMTLVAAVTPTIGHIVTYLVPDSLNQQLNGLAKTLQTNVENIKAVIPEIEYSYPTGPNNKSDVTTPSESNINKISPS